MNMKTAVMALSLILLLLVGCAPKPKAEPPAVPVPAQPVAQPVPAVAEQSATSDVDSFESELNELDQLDADLSELESI